MGDVVECYVDRHTQNSLETGEVPSFLVARPEPSPKLEGGAVFASQKDLVIEMIGVGVAHAPV
jgi:hypothetical protein